MAEPRMISPLLDNFLMGGAMSEHHGVRCYPAIENETGDKYIIKVISVPATPTQLDALLLTGAYSDKASAIAYFADMARGTMDEVDILEKLTELEGFTAYSACQMVPMESGDGFEIYLLGTYKRALDKHFQKHPFTHLDALNLGIDLCAALSVCRSAGYLYVDLKPSNVYVNEQKQFQIGDLGFLRLDTLKYTSVPEKYISTYTPPEICDAFSQLNDTMDVYAAGLILYHAYNNGELPFNLEVKPGDTLPAPLYADYEMSEIILKACAANPEDRWQDPAQMGQAIIGYMQRNGASDTPIVPIPAPKDTQDDAAVDEARQENIVPIPVVAELSDDVCEETKDEAFGEDIADSLAEQPPESHENNAVDDGSEPIPVEEFSDTDGQEDVVDETSEDVALTEEVSEMLNQADELATMAVPEPVIVPDYIEVPVPVPAEPEVPIKENVEPHDPSAETSGEDDSESTEEAGEEEDLTDEADSAPKRKCSWVGILILVLLLATLFVGGYFFYKEYYLVPIEIRSVEGDLNTLTVRLSANIDESNLIVVCSGDYGSKLTAPVVNGEAEFTDLAPNTAYTVHIEVNGFHKLVGNTTTSYTTPKQINVLQFDAITGDTEDSAILTFTVEGHSGNEWFVCYYADGEAEQTTPFTEHMVTLTNLTVGKEYTFRLVSENDLYVTGQSTIKFTPRSIVIAKNLQATSCINNALSVTWESPDASIASWSVHCYNETYNKTIVTTETSVTFTDLDHTAGYTVEVKAAGMSKGADVVIPANSVTAENFQINTTDRTKLILSWLTTQEIPDEGWLLRYSIAGTNKEETITCSTNSATITPLAHDATYIIRLEDKNGNVLLNSQRTIVTGEPIEFSKELNGVSVQASDLEFTMCKTPDLKVWGTYDLSADDYRSQFTVGESASFLVKFSAVRHKPDEDVTILYVTRNQDGGIIHSGTQANNWKNMWTTTYAKLTIPVTPGIPGEYTVDIYFDGMLVHRQSFTIKQ